MKKAVTAFIVAVCSLVLSSCGKTATAIIFTPAEVNIRLSDGAPATTVKVDISLNGDIPNGKTSYQVECNVFDEDVVDVDPHSDGGYWILVTGKKPGETNIDCNIKGFPDIRGRLPIKVTD